jgi:putative endonuclease
MTGANIKQIRGDFGEAAACDYISERGYELVMRNYAAALGKSGKQIGEIDLIALDSCRNEIVFVEVKTRKFDSLTDGIDSVTPAKIKRIIAAAHAFLAAHPRFEGINARFDVAEVTVTTERRPAVIEIRYHEDVFDPALF